DEPSARQPIDAGEVGACEHRSDTGRRFGTTGVDLQDVGVRMRRAHEDRVRRVRTGDIARVLASPGEEANVLFPSDRLADQARAHDSSRGEGYVASRLETPAAAAIAAAPCWTAFTTF